MKKPKIREDMIKYLKGHTRYWVMNSWNRASSYARIVKIRSIEFPSKDVENRAYSLLEVEEAFSDALSILHDFDARHNYAWQIEQNGRSGGYLVLIHGGTRPSGYKSYCTGCTQRNYKSITESGKQCGRCGEMTRVDYKKEPVTIFTQGIGTDDDVPGFETWDMDGLKDRVNLVWDFDLTCESAVRAFIDFCETHEAVDEEIMVPKTIKRAREI